MVVLKGESPVRLGHRLTPAAGGPGRDAGAELDKLALRGEVGSRQGLAERDAQRPDILWSEAGVVDPAGVLSAGKACALSGAG